MKKLAAVIATLIISGGWGHGSVQAAEVAFPRLGSIAIGGPHNYHQLAYQQELARRDIAILGLYNGWGQGGKTPAQVVAEIKALNPDMLIGNYTVVTEVCDTCTGDVYKRDKLDTEIGPGGVGDWWARDNAGVKTDWADGQWGAHDVNLTLAVTPDANGDYWPQWLAKKDHELLFQGIGFDIWFFDNNFWRPRSRPDWDGDGTNDDPDDPVVRDLWRAGQRAHYDQAVITAPSLYLMINADSDLTGEVYPWGEGIFTEYKDIVHGALLEGLIGLDWSIETWGSWEEMMQWYYKIFDNLLAPKMVMFTVVGPRTDYQLFRYGFTSCLLNDGYCQHVESKDWESYDPLPWFDEYDLAGTATTKWLGAAVDLPPMIPWQNGVYRREFENGIVLVNPKGNGQQAVTVEPGYKKIPGLQEPIVNNGLPASGITLGERDGIVLVRSSCGNGTVEFLETCDDGNLVDGDGCDSNCTLTGCSNGIVTAGEECDDGNLVNGDCCSTACQFESVGSACNDGDACTQPDVCNGAGTCMGAQTPEATCRQALRGGLRLSDRSPDSKDRLAWKWGNGAATSSADLGSPVSGPTSYDFCVYDEVAGVWGLVTRAGIPASGTCGGKACWKAVKGGLKGYVYSDHDATTGGIRKLVLKPGAEGKARINVKGKGTNLDMPTLPLAQGTRVTAQLKSSEGLCWGTEYYAPANSNDTGKFKDKVAN